MATTATLSSNSCKSTIVFYTFYFRSAETVLSERHVSLGSEQLQVSARVKKLGAAVWCSAMPDAKRILSGRDLEDATHHVAVYLFRCIKERDPNRTAVTTEA